MSLLATVLLWLGLLALIAGILRSRELAAGWLTAAGLAWLAWQLWRWPTQGQVAWLGRTIDLGQTNQLLDFTFHLDIATRGVVEILLVWGALFAFVGGWMRADRVLFPTMPLILAALILAISSAPLLWAPIWFALAVILMTFPIQGATPRPARGALRMLTAPFLALPLFLFAAWVLKQNAIAENDPELWANAWRALIFGVGILLTPIPLHGWIVAQGESAPPYAAAFVIGVWQIAIYAWVRRLLLAYPMVDAFIDPAQVLPWLALAGMAWAGVFGLGSKRLNQLWGYLLLFDFGAAFLLWSLTGEIGLRAMIWLSLARPLALLLAATGVHALQQRFDDDLTYENLAGAMERLPLAVTSFVAGGLFLLGWPLGALFPARLTTYLLLESSHPRAFLWALLAMTLMTLAVIRAFRNLSRPLQDKTLPREPKRLLWLTPPLLAVGFLLFLNPPALNALADRLAAWLSAL